jgi:hypothetical protein
MARENSTANGQRLHISNFYLTINTNRCVKITADMSPAERTYYEKFEKAVSTHFAQSLIIPLSF